MTDVGCVRLAVAVDSADALLEPVRVERDVEVDEPVAVVLEVDALAGGVGGEKDPHGRLGGILVESGTDQFAGLGIRAALDDLDAFILITLLAKDVAEPAQSVDVLGEDDEALVVPIAVGTERALDVREQCFEP